MTDFIAMWFTFFIALLVLALGSELSNERKHEGWMVGAMLAFYLILRTGGILS